MMPGGTGGCWAGRLPPGSGCLSAGQCPQGYTLLGSLPSPDGCWRGERRQSWRWGLPGLSSFREAVAAPRLTP